MVVAINDMNTCSPIFQNSKISKKSLEKLNSKTEDGISAYTIMLNKSFSENVVEYAHTLYTTILDLKDSSKELGYFLDEYKTVEDKIETLDNNKKEQVNHMFEEKVKKFVYDYDNAFNFANNQSHSPALLNFSSELYEITDEYEQILTRLGIDESDSNELIINFDLNNTTDKRSIRDKLEGIKSFVSEIYNSTQNILSAPMSEHMNFKALKYYYNYKLDRYQSNTFELIEVGMIVDVAL